MTITQATISTAPTTRPLGIPRRQPEPFTPTTSGCRTALRLFDILHLSYLCRTRGDGGTTRVSRGPDGRSLTGKRPGEFPPQLFPLAAATGVPRDLMRAGWTIGDRWFLFEGQNGRCAICRAVLDFFDWRHAVVDRDRETLRPRGLVCSGCDHRLHRVERRLSFDPAPYLAYLRLHGAGA